jgi:hypothetical protein
VVGAGDEAMHRRPEHRACDRRHRGNYEQPEVERSGAALLVAFRIEHAISIGTFRPNAEPRSDLALSADVGGR